MRHLFHNILCIACALLCFACGAEDDPAALGGKGYLRLSVGQSNELTTKADEYKFDRIAVDIKNSENKTVKSTTDFDAEWKGKQIELPVGEYTIEAYSYAWDGEAGADKAYYKGSDKVTIESGKPATAEVKCYLANVKVTVAFEEAFLEALGTGSMAVQIQNVNDKTQTYQAVDFEAKAGKQVCYFAATDLDIKYTVTNAEGEKNNDTHELRCVKAKTHYLVTFKLPQQGQSDFTVTVDGTMTQYECTITVNPNDASAALLSVNPWAKFAYLKAESVNPGGADISSLKFQYREKDTEAWTDAEATEETDEESNKFYTGKTGELKPATKYEYRLASADGKSFTTPAEEFTTEAATVLPNSSFDGWSDASFKTYNGVPYPIAPTETIVYGTSGDKSPISFWDSGNAGGAMAEKYPTEKFEENGKTGAKLSSQFVGILGAGKFAAGNIYTGHYYYTSIWPMGAQIFFGQPFTSRPTQLKGRFKYTRGTTIDYGEDPYKSELSKSGGDQCGLYIALTDNEGLECDGNKYAFEIDNLASADDADHFKYKNTIDFSEKNKNIVAYGTISETEAKGTGEWQDFVIDLKYRDLTRVPKYIIVVASASKYGDYFTGSSGSVMYIDDFELVYGDNPVVEEKTK